MMTIYGGLREKCLSFSKCFMFFLLVMGVWGSSFQAYGLSTAEHNQYRYDTYLVYEVSLSAAVDVLLKKGVSPDEIEAVLSEASLTDAEKLELLFEQVAGLWVFDLSQYEQFVILIACKWYQLDCWVGDGVEEVVDYTNRVVTSAADDMEEAVDEVVDYGNRIVTSAADDVERVVTSAADDLEHAANEVADYGNRIYTSARDDVDRMFGGSEKDSQEESTKAARKEADKEMGAGDEELAVGIIGAVTVRYRSKKSSELTGDQRADLIEKGYTRHKDEYRDMVCSFSACFEELPLEVQKIVAKELMSKPPEERVCCRSEIRIRDSKFDKPAERLPQ